MLVRKICSFTLVICFGIAQTVAQRPQPGPGAGPPGGPEQKAATSDNPYAELTKSKDSKTKGLADRYGNLIKYQEWGTASGKSIVAKYVSHDPDMKHVKLAVPGKGTGKDRATQEYDVPIEKLNKTSQSRVKQIDTLQKKLDELASAEPKSGEGGAQPGVPEAGAEGHGRAVRGRYGRPAKGADATTAGPEGAQAPGPQPPAQAQAPAVDPSASEPDPLGFAELPPVSPGPGPGAGPGAAPGPAPNADGGPGAVPAAQPQ
jgi:hypothetical protein